MTTIKRYSNRKLYDSEAGQYITLEEIAARIRQGEDIRVIDHVSGIDLTTATLLQIILEEEKKAGGLFPHSMLTHLIQSSGERVQSMRESVNAFLNPAEFVEKDIRARLERLTAHGVLNAQDAAHWEELLLRHSVHTPPTAGNIPADAIPREAVQTMQEQIAALEKAVRMLEEKKQKKTYG